MKIQMTNVPIIGQIHVIEAAVQLYLQWHMGDKLTVWQLDTIVNFDIIMHE